MASARHWRLPWYAWFLIGPPLLAFLVGNAILAQWGGTDFDVAQPFSADGHLEAAGRLRTFATFLLYVAFAIGSTVYAFCIALRTGSKQRLCLGGACLATLVIGAIAVKIFDLDRGDEYIEIGFACASFEQLQPLADEALGRTERAVGQSQVEAGAGSAGQKQRAGADSRLSNVPKGARHQQTHKRRGRRGSQGRISPAHSRPTRHPQFPPPGRTATIRSASCA